MLADQQYSGHTSIHDDSMAEKLIILSDLHVGTTGVSNETVRMDPDQHMGDLYPFSLAQKLEGITENSEWYSDPASTPWGRAIIPMEMPAMKS
jgi:hypothetical protein